ncbi:MAG: hypothetical protein M1118_11570 [Chloroflexi bacterium]|nr:hypothetical protein [Chloroflexota bacterium]
MITPIQPASLPSSRRSRPTNILRVAWIAIWLGCCVFLLIVSGSVYAVIHYLSTAWEPRQATISAISGSVLVQKPTWARPAPASRDQHLGDGDRLWTGKDNQSFATVQFWEGSELHVGPHTEITVVRLRSNRYQLLSTERRLVVIALDSGRVEASVVKFDSQQSRFSVVSLGTTVQVVDGTTDVWLTQPHAVNDSGGNSRSAPFTISCCSTQVLTLDGQAVVSAPGGETVLNGNQRATVPMGGAPITADHASWDLLVNWSLQPGTDGLPEGWHVGFDPPQPLGQYGNHLSYASGTNPYLHLFSVGSNSQHRAVSFTQQINRDVQDFLNVKLELAFRINAQSLPGGGLAGSEYPFRVSVDYRDSNGAEHRWFHGYYILPPEGSYIADPQSQRVVAGKWYTASSPQTDLVLSDLPDPPVFVYSVEFSASGWDFSTDVREVRLVAQ